MKKLLISMAIFSLAACTTSPQSTVTGDSSAIQPVQKIDPNITYGDFKKLQDQQRHLYIMGVIDAQISGVMLGQRITEPALVLECLSNHSNGSIDNFLKNSPDNALVTHAIINGVNSTC